MAEVLAGIQGKFLLSLNDTPEVRETFSAFSIKSVGTAYSLASHKEESEHERVLARSMSM